MVKRYDDSEKKVVNSNGSYIKKKLHFKQSSKKNSSKSCKAKLEKAENDSKVSCLPGSGRIVTSGQTVHGFETKFKEEISIGDYIIILHPKQLDIEEKLVTGVLSQRCLTISEQFSNDFTSTTTFTIRKSSDFLDKKINSDNPDCNISEVLDKKIKTLRPTITYREKTGLWGYRTITKKAPKHLTSEEILDYRSKMHGRDKYCW